jgi:hypothetical protein
VLFAVLKPEIKTEYGAIMILTNILMIWALVDKRKEIRRRYDEILKAMRDRRKG